MSRFWSYFHQEIAMRKFVLLASMILGLSLPSAGFCAGDKAAPDKVVAAVPLDASLYTHVPEVIYGRKFGMALTFDVFTPKKNANGAAIIFVVSGGWLSDREAFAPFYGPMVGLLLERGYTVFPVCHGCQPKFTIPEAIADINRSVRFIRAHAKDYGISPDRIGISGGSAGGHLSLMQGTAGDAGDPNAKDPLNRVSSRVQAVGCFFPPTDFVNYGGKNKYAFAKDGLLAFLRPCVDVREFDPKTLRYEHLSDEKKVLALAREISPITHVTAETAPTLIIHGDADKLVPIEQAEVFVAKLKELKVPAELVVKKGAGHGWAKPESDMAAIEDWFDKYLNKK
jgi:acetyl esterase/lipase